MQITRHAKIRMDERNVSYDDIMNTIKYGNEWEHREKDGRMLYQIKGYSLIVVANPTQGRVITMLWKG